MGNLRGSMGIRWASGGASGDQGPCAPPGGRRRTTPWPVASDRRGCTNVKRVNNDRGRACGGSISLALVPKTTCRVGAISTPNLSAGKVSKRGQSTRIWRPPPPPSPPRAHRGLTPGPPRRAVACEMPPRAVGPGTRWCGRGRATRGYTPGRSPDAPTAGPPRSPARRPPGVGPRVDSGCGGRPAKSG